MDYDLDQLHLYLYALIGPGITLSGQDTKPFQLRVPLGELPVADRWLPASEAETSMAWTSARVYDVPLGPGELNGRLKDGWLSFAPLDVTAAEGRLRVEPILRLAPRPMELHLRGRKVVEQARISREMCARGRKYAAPILADTTEAEGRFSVELERSRIPFANPAAGQVKGRFTLHSVEVAPTPLTRELIALVETLVKGRAPNPERNRTVKLSRESTVPFEMIDGRVHHRNLEMVFDDVVVRTSGSVGLDQTLDLVAEIPVTISGAAQVIRVPVRGTLSKPQVDQRALGEANAKLLNTAAEEAINRGVNKLFDRLTPPRR